MVKSNIFAAVSLSIGAVSLGLFSGCAAVGHKTEGGAVAQIIRDSNSQDQAKSASHGVEVATSSHPLEVWGKKMRNTKFDYPVIMNPSVEHWITYFTGKGRKYFEKYLERSRYFVPTIAKVLRSHNMPQDLVYLAMIESGFNNSARSRARAVGPWQFMKFTGQRYGLIVDYWLDERRDTRKSTLAAMAYLKELYQEFGSWELAAAGYNAGENKVRRAIAKYRTNDFWEISRHKFFKRETRDYVPKIMAAAILTKNPEQFDFANPFEGLKRNPTIASADATADESDMAEPTPKELGEPLAKEETLDDADKADDKDDTADAEDHDDSGDPAIVLQSPNPSVSPSVYMVSNPNEQILEYEIKGPSDLFAISKASGLPYSTVKLLNPELMRWCTPPYMKTYRVKLPASIKDRFLATYNDESFDRKVVFMHYTVRRGDTVTKVARHFGVDPGPIREINQMSASAVSLRSGASINLPIPTGYKRVIASMYDEKPLPARRSRRRRHRRHQTSNAVHRYRIAPSLASGTDS